MYEFQSLDVFWVEESNLSSEFRQLVTDSNE